MWVVGKRATAPGDKGGTSTYGARDRWLWVVLERAGDTLLDASAAVGAFRRSSLRRRFRRLVSRLSGSRGGSGDGLGESSKVRGPVIPKDDKNHL